MSGFGYLAGELGEVGSDQLHRLTVVERLSSTSGPVIVDHPENALGPARCVLGARMRVADQLIGYLIVESATPSFFTADHAERLVAVADQAGAVLSNSQLALRASEVAAVEERQRLARDLHDAVNQTLWTAALSAEALLKDVPPNSDLFARTERLQQLTRGALSEMRSLLLELRPTELADVELHHLIDHLLNAVEGRQHLELHAELEEVHLDPEDNVAFYRIAQQALSNLTQHSGASAVNVRLLAGPPVLLSIADNGRGFDIESIPSGHLGIQIMRERAEALGALFTIDTALNAGTTITVTLQP